jgi:2-amino-4-hydroxy-6-hydroxymethyldihydropteridine diphosphokinase
MSLASAFIGLGSNLGDRLQHIRSALRLLELSGAVIVRQVSPAYENRAIGMGEAADFINVVAELATELNPADLLQRCLAIESQLGRVRSDAWIPRTIDLDVLIHGDCVQQTAELTLPHPRICQRDFVLVPLADIAADLYFQGQRVAEHLRQLPTVDLRPHPEPVLDCQRLRMIAAVSTNLVIGKDGELPWAIAEDWAHFLAKTRGGCLIMGRKSFLEMVKEPDWRQQRTYVVITSQPQALAAYSVLTAPDPQLALERALETCAPIWVCGGERIYEAFLPLADELHLSCIRAELEGDTYFPDWRVQFPRETASAAAADAHYHYSFKKFER